MMRYKNLSGSTRLCDMPQGSTFSRDGERTVYLLGQLEQKPMQDGEHHRYYVTNLETGEVLKMETELFAEMCVYVFCKANLIANAHAFC